MGLLPKGMHRVEGMTRDQNDAVQRIALEIFCDMSNAGYPLAQIVAAIYVSGLEHAVKILGAPRNDNAPQPKE